MNKMLEIGSDLIKKYDCMAPRYTSYPTAPQFSASFGPDEFRKHAEISNASLLPKDISVYVHIPFCQSLCYFCGCNKIVTQTDNRKVEDYLDQLMSEIVMRGRLFNDDRLVTQIHFGGGTPNFLSVEQLAEILDAIATQFHLDLPTNLEISIEIDPRAITPGEINRLANVGFNRFSIGVQDFSGDVQQAINRVQSEADTIATIEAAMKVSESVNVDLITGLPNQSVGGFAETLDKIIATGVTRVAAYSFAYMPERIKAQRMIDESSLPDAAERMAIAGMTRDRLIDAGYQHIGMDHYALAEDSLAKAAKAGTLQRNFQGYTTHKDTDLIGIGASAISKFDTAYSQNSPALSAYSDMLNANTLPIVKGISLTPDDRLRAITIQQIMCKTNIDLDFRISRFLEKHSDITLLEYFDTELNNLEEFVSDRLIVPTRVGFDITPQGTFFLRQISAVFDSYLHPQKPDESGPVVQFSRAI